MLNRERKKPILHLSSYFLDFNTIARDLLSSSSENIDVVSGEQQVARLITEIIPKVSSKIDCVDPRNILGQLINLKQYIKVRLVTEITRDNLPYYKEITKHIDIRHLENVKGCFALCDGTEYLGCIYGKQSEQVEMLHITRQSTVYGQQLFRSRIN
jgi:sugar-specific transcriptional regulator TrmB